MDNRRRTIVASLVIVELWIVGVMVRSISYKAPASGLAATAGPLQAAQDGAAPMGDVPGGQGEAGSGVSKTIETGLHPHVYIDDDAATLTITVRPGSSVTVEERTSRSGWVSGHGTALAVRKTSDGVRIERATGMVVIIGSFDRRLNVIVPPAARLEVANAGFTTATGLRESASFHTDSDPIVVNDQRGDLRVETDSGRIELHHVDALSVATKTDSGRVLFDRVRAGSVSAKSDSGRIEAVASTFNGGSIATSDGRVVLGLIPDSNVTVNATSSSGRIRALPPLSGVRSTESNDDRTAQTVRIGDGSGQLEVTSDDGSITIRTGERTAS